MTGVGDKIKNVMNRVTGKEGAATGVGGGYETGGTHGTGTHGTGTHGVGHTGAGTEYGERSSAAAGMTTQSAGQQYGTTEQQYASQEQYGSKEQYATTGTTTGAATVGAAGVGVGEAYETGRTGVCAQEYFTKSEDRPIVKERVEYVKEHRPVEKEFVVETRATGREREVREGRVTEHLGTQERIVSEAQPRSPCE